MLKKWALPGYTFEVILIQKATGLLWSWSNDELYLTNLATLNLENKSIPTFLCYLGSSTYIAFLRSDAAYKTRGMRLFHEEQRLLYVFLFHTMATSTTVDFARMYIRIMYIMAEPTVSTWDSLHTTPTVMYKFSTTPTHEQC